MTASLRNILRSRWLPWAALALAALAGAAWRYAAVDHLYPRNFSYFTESCIRFRYAEMRMLGRDVPATDPAAQWPEGFPVDRMILSAPDRLAAAFYDVHGGDTFLASRALVILFSAAAVAAFVPLALAVLRKPWPAAGATLLYAGLFGAYSRTWGNYLREDFAMPGLLAATAAVAYLLTSPEARRRWLVAAGAAAATLWAGSCWHMSQFYLAILGVFVVAYGLAGRPERAAWAGGGLWLGLAAAAILNKPLWVKGALWNVSAALAFAPPAAYLLARAARRPARARWFLAGGAALLVALSLAFGRSEGYGHVYALIWAKVIHLGRYPGPAALSPEARIFWVAGYNSPTKAIIFFEYGLTALLGAWGLGAWWYAVAKKRLAGGAFAAVAGPAFLVLYLLMMRLSIFLAPWVAIFGIYAAAAARRRGLRVAAAAALVLAWGFHVYLATAKNRPPWLNEAVYKITSYQPERPWYYGNERNELLTWVAAFAPPGAVLAEPGQSPPFLYLAAHPIALHPMFEVPEGRRKALAYAEAALGSEEELYELCEEWRVRYVVHFAPQVLSHDAGSLYMATGREPPAGSAAYLMQFEPRKLRRFRLLVETYNVRLYEAGTAYDGYAAPAYHPLFDPGRFAAVPTEEELDSFYEDLRRATYFYGMGCAAQAGGDHVAAAAAFSTALRHHPDFEDAELRLGECHLALGQAEEAREALRRAAATRPGDPRAAEYLRLLGAQGDVRR
jgi:tetratricopeptide (TPR) repeat protein